MLNLYENLAYKQDGDASVIACNVAQVADNDNRVNILLVEDDFSDALMTVNRIKATQIPYCLDRIIHGNDVLPYPRNCRQARLPEHLVFRRFP